MVDLLELLSNAQASDQAKLIVETMNRQQMQIQALQQHAAGTDQMYAVVFAILTASLVAMGVWCFHLQKRLRVLESNRSITTCPIS